LVTKGKYPKRQTEPSLPQVELPSSMSIKRLADVLRVEPVKLIKQLMRKGIMANVNQIIDFETASTLASECGYIAQEKEERKIKISHPLEGGSKLQPRPPIVTVLGHVDHGKTTLLDMIRKTNVTAREAGAITQHIGAYQATVNDRKITFLDTPGHEAFTTMRARGAQVTDIVILVVAADDGVMPQTLEAANHAKAAGVPVVVAINKIDKANANVEHTKQQLADLGLIIEEWGGDTICVPISAKKGEGLQDLLENLFLLADMLELKADPTTQAEGVVLESRMDKTRGPLATLLIQKGTLRTSNVIVAGNTWGKIKAIFDDKGKQIHKCGPATPVEVLGLGDVPRAGNVFLVSPSEHHARDTAEKQAAKTSRSSLSLSAISSQISEGETKMLNIVLKTDVDGSIEPIKSSIERLSTEKVKAKVIHSASGSITESDIILASASNGIVIGFNARVAPGATQLAAAEGINIYNYDIIYKMIEDIDKVLHGMLEPVYDFVLIGRAQIRAIFPSKGKGTIAGIYVNEGKIQRSATVKVIRGGAVIYESNVSSLKRFKDDVSEVNAGFECGVGIEGFSDFQVGDTLEFYHEEKVT
jgi:translation initiation factor IF-2